MEANKRAAEIANKNDTLVILNPAPACEIPDAILSLTDLLTPNESETEILTGMPTHSNEQAIEAAHNLLSKGIETVILTLGSRGSFLLTEKMEKLIPAYSVNVIDTTAAGDAYCGALAASLAQDTHIEEAVKIANAAGALAVTKLGAEPSLPTKKAIDQLLAK
jgi:ribokinase